MSKDRPALSVIVAASDSTQAVARTLDALRAQDAIDQAEIIVVADSARIRPVTPTAIPKPDWVAAAPGSGVPRLRRLGLDRARGAIVVFTEDSCLFPPDWLSAWIQAFSPPLVRAATGPVEPAMGDAALDWAVFFCEYAAYLPRPAPHECPPTRLAGNNFAVRVATVEVGPLASLTSLAQAEIQENEVHRELRQLQATIVEANATARHVRRYGWREAFGDRLRFGYEFGQLRAQWHSKRVNAVAFLAAPAIGSVQLARLIATIRSRHRHHGRFLTSLPITLGLLTAWSVGEALGWTRGPQRPPRSVDNGCETAGQTPAPTNGRTRPPRDCTSEPGTV